jgi:hypothetical protein
MLVGDEESAARIVGQIAYIAEKSHPLEMK